MVLYDPGPTEEYDSFGYIKFIAELQASQRQGKTALSHLQWSTIKHVKTNVANHKQLNKRWFRPLVLVEGGMGVTQHFQGGGTSSPLVSIVYKRV